jgi:hypothetical protein
MANEQSGLPLRRWRPFFLAFEAIDGVIEACGYPRSEFRDVRGEIVVLLRGATDDGVAEQLCAALDDVMVESLKTLLVAPVPHDLLASTDLARTVGALGSHGSFRIRSLARDVVRGWRVSIKASFATAVAVKKKLDNLSADQIPLPRAAVDEKKLHVPSAKMLPAAAEVHNKKPRVPPAKMLHAATAAEVHDKKSNVPPAKRLPAADDEVHNKRSHVPPAKMLPTADEHKKQHPTKTLPTVAILSNQQKNVSETKKPAVAESEKMEATKRKLRESYQEADGVKHRRNIQTIREEEGKLLEQEKWKMHASHRMKRGPVGCRTKTSSSFSRSRPPPSHLL